MKTWVVKRIAVVAVLAMSVQANAKETIDLSKALSASTQEQQTAEQESKEVVREMKRGPASEKTNKARIVVDFSNLEG